MGGYGSGRKFGANCTEDSRSIDIRRWQREGYLATEQHLDWVWQRNGEKVASISVEFETGQLRLIYSCRKQGAEWEKLNYPVKLQTSVCYYGGVRYWFTCPLVGCGRRVALLYLGDKYFACRRCYHLAYKSQRKTANDRIIHKADKIREKLNWQRGILNPSGSKPKGMHWKTYRRLVAEHDFYTYQSMVGIMAKLKIKSPSGSF